MVRPDGVSAAATNGTRPILSNIQALRFVAAFAILFTHAATHFLPSDSLVLDLPWTAGVDLFYVISGFIMAWLTAGSPGGGREARRFLLRRIIRIVPPYWAFTLLAIATILVLPGEIGNVRLDGASVATSLLFLPWPRPDGTLSPLLAQGWTLIYEMSFYLAVAATLAVRVRPTVLCALFVIIAALHYALPGSWWMARFYSQPIILEFAAGLLLHEAYARGVRLPPMASLGLVAAAGAGFWLAAGLPFFEGDRLWRLGLPALLLASAVILAPEPKQRGPLRRAAELGGDASYTLYLSHGFTANLVAVAWDAAGLDAPVLALGVTLIVAILASVGLFLLIERPVTLTLQRKAGFDGRHTPMLSDAP